VQHPTANVDAATRVTKQVAHRVQAKAGKKTAAQVAAQRS
jgi:hypothetical protein